MTPDPVAALLACSGKGERGESGDRMAAGLLERIRDPQRLLDQARREGVAGLLHGALGRWGLYEMLPEEAISSLSDAYRETTARTLALRRRAAALLARAAGAGIPVALLKGIALQQRIYPDPGTRPMADLDLWVRPRDRTGFAALLAAEGYAPAAGSSNLYDRQGVLVDLHTDPLGADRIRSRRDILGGADRALFDRCVEDHLEGSPCLRLEREDEVVLLALHLLKHNVERLIWVEDVRRLLPGPRDTDGIRLLEERAARLGHLHTLDRVRYLIEDLCRPRMAGGTRRLPRTERRLLHKRAARGRLPAWAPLLLFTPPPAGTGRFRYLLETLFPRPSVLREIFPRQARWPAPMLYGMRSVQLVIWAVSPRQASGKDRTLRSSTR